MVKNKSSRANRSAIPHFKAARALARKLGFNKTEAAILVMKATVIGELDTERMRRGLNNNEFCELLGISKTRWSGVFKYPEKISLGYLLTLAGKCDVWFELITNAE